MPEFFVDAIKGAGGFALANLALAAVGLMVAFITLVFAVVAPRVAEWAAVICLLGVLAIFGFGVLGYAMVMEDTMRAVPNVPLEQQDRLLQMGTHQALGNFVVAAVAALAPFLAALVATVRTRFRPALVLSIVAFVAYAVTVVMASRNR